jgi:hypothetical protein
MTQSRRDVIAADIDQLVDASNARRVAFIAVRAALSANPASESFIQEVVQALERGDWRTAQIFRAAAEAAASRLDEHSGQSEHT